MIQTLAIIRGAVLTLAVGLSVSALAESGDPVPDADAGEGNTELEGYFKGNREIQKEQQQRLQRLYENEVQGVDAADAF